MEASNNKFKRVMSGFDARIETVVGFEDDTRRLMEQLLGGKKKLQIMSVVGMAGIGKTTLVKKVFNEPSVVYHFHVRAWTTVTQEPKKRDLLLAILKTGFNAEIEDCSDMELSETLKRRLSGQRYMVVMDDIWEGKDWDDLMLCFPDDKVGSRIVFTSRIADMPLLVQTGCYQHPLHLLTEKESWDLLKYKVVLEESCPPSLIEIGMHIARKCHGLPLSIVLIAGILAIDMTMKWWSKVAQDMRSITSNAPEQYLGTLVLSYNHLPDHLKPCFLYFIAFPEDYEIPAWKLILLWVAEGFVKIQTMENNLEEVATGYLEELISRSMVIVSQRRSNGGIKTCIIHDALRDLCMKKADEVKYLYQLPPYQQYGSKLATSTRSMVQRLYSREVVEDNLHWQLKRYSNFHPSAPMVHKLCRSLPSLFKWTKTITLYPNIKTILCFNGSGSCFAKVRYQNDRLSKSEHITQYMHVLIVFKSLRVLDLSGIEIPNIPENFESLPELRYIALCTQVPDDCSRIYTSTFSLLGLKYLETFVVHNRSTIGFDVHEVWMLYRLRHLILKGQFYGHLPEVQTLSHLQTLSCPIALKHHKRILNITPNLRKLRINAALYLSSTELVIPSSDQFPNLQHLKLDECLQLEEIPIGIGDIYTLEMIEIRNCSPSVVKSAHEIKEDQVNKGNVLSFKAGYFTYFILKL